MPLAALLSPACSLDYAQRCTELAVTAGSRHECEVPGWLDRAFSLEVPAAWDGGSSLPVLFVFHGGGGNRQSANRVSCPDGDTAAPACLAATALARGYAVVTPDGTGGR
ncbi:MAG TPA: hypothetical protein PKU97_02335, partial [Kofleriaceae bacterium]|nr:hypothetical protein [Kofleriaceae bacterium]